MQVVSGKQLFDGFAGITESFRRIDLLMDSPRVDAALKADPDLEWAIALLIEAGFTPQMLEVAYTLRAKPPKETP